MNDARNVSTDHRDPTLTCSTLVMPDPISLPGLVETHIAHDEGAAPAELPYMAPRCEDSPDDLLAEAYPTLSMVDSREELVALSELAVEIAAQIRRELIARGDGSLSSPPLVQTRFGSHRRDSGGTPVVWMEFYIPELEKYAIPDLSYLNNARRLGGFYDPGGEGLELFVDGPARITLESVRNEDGFRVKPWISSLAAEEAESNFARGIRRLAEVGDSYLASDLKDEILRFVVREGLCDGESFDSEGGTFLETLGEVEVLSISTQTDRSRRYQIRYPLLDDDRGNAHLVCDVSLGEHPVWGLRLDRALMKVAVQNDR